MNFQHLKKQFKKALFLFATAALLSLTQTQDAAAKKLDMSHLSFQESATQGAFRSDNGELGITGCDISYNKLVTITFKSIDSSGGSDAQPAIQAALDYARDNRQNDTMYKIEVPAGSYRLDRHLFIYDNTWLCLKPDTKLIKNYDRSCMIKSNDNQSMFYSYAGASNIVIEGGIWYTDTAAFPGESTAIRFGHGSDVYLKNIMVDGNSNGHHVSLCGVKDVTIEGCTFTGVSRGVGAHSAVYGVYYNDIAIKNCSFKDIDKQAILGMNFKNFVVKNNTLTDVGSGIQVRYANPDGENYYEPNPGVVSRTDADARVVISGNTIATKLTEKQSNSYGIYIAGGRMGKTDYYVENAAISGNKISSEAHAIYLEYTNRSTVTQNTISKITLNSKAAPSNAICLTNSDRNTVSGNTMGNTKSYALIGHGISLREGSTDNLIKSNTVNKAKRAGIILADGSAARILNNTIKNAGVSGIIVTDKKTVGTLVSGNKITGSKTMGISVSAGAKATLKKNTIQKSGKHGICFTSAKGTASKNTCKKNGGLGICCVKSNSVKLSGNKLSGNKKGAIYQGAGA